MNMAGKFGSAKFLRMLSALSGIGRTRVQPDEVRWGKVIVPFSMTMSGTVDLIPGIYKDPVASQLGWTSTPTTRAILIRDVAVEIDDPAAGNGGSDFAKLKEGLYLQHVPTGGQKTYRAGIGDAMRTTYNQQALVDSDLATTTKIGSTERNKMQALPYAFIVDAQVDTLTLASIQTPAATVTGRLIMNAILFMNSDISEFRRHFLIGFDEGCKCDGPDDNLDLIAVQEDIGRSPETRDPSGLPVIASSIGRR